MESREGYKSNDKNPASPSTPTDAASSMPQPWDAQYHHQALEHKLDSSLATMMAQLELLTARIAVPPPVQGQPVRNEAAPRQAEDPVVEAQANARMQPRVPRRQQQVHDDYAEEDYADFAEESEAEFEPPQRRDRPRQPHFRRAGRAYPPYQPRRADTDSLLNNIKTSIPEFKGIHDPDLYLDWERRVNKIFDCYDFPEVKKVQLASMEFTGYAADWWENIQNRRHRDRYPPIDTWQEMKDVMRGRFIPVNYERELERRLSQIRQGTRTIEEYHKELETALIRVGKEETLVATINRYIEGMQPDIACEVELKDFTSIEAMIHYASIVERQIKEGRRRSSHSTPVRTPWVRGESSTPRTVPERPQGQPTQPARRFEQSAPQPNRRPDCSAAPAPNQTRPAPSNPQNGTPGRARDVQCHKCRGWGHFQAQCPNRRVLFLSEQNELESASEEEEELDEAEAVGDSYQPLDSPIMGEIEDEKPKQAHVSLVSIRALSLIREEEQNDQRENIFYSRCSIQDKVCSLIIDSGSVVNAISQYAVGKLELVPQKHPKPYKLQWLTDRSEICVGYQVPVTFSIGYFTDTVLCDVIPMEAAHILLGRPWQFDRKAIHDGFANTYAVTREGRTTRLWPLAPKDVIEDQMRMQEKFKEEKEKRAESK